MTNLLLHEFDNELAERAALYGADKGATITRHEAHWTAPLGGCSISISLDASGRVDYLVPRIVLGSSSSLPSDPLFALARLRDNEATIHKALAAFYPLASLRVWPKEAPCDFCGGRGDRSACACGGAGKRTAS